tara:strand:- start:3639 stop:4142 length:504 start_codon:yes stop_codon:yes gene_type:complete
MDYNNIIIFLIFCLTLSLIYTSYIKFEQKYNIQDKTKTKPKKEIEDFFIDDLSIEKFNENSEAFNDKEGFVNELIMSQKKINNEFEYLDIPIETKENIIKPGEELIKKHDSNLSKLNNIYNNYDKKESNYTYEKTKKLSTDLPIANLHTNILLKSENDDIKLSNLNL